MIELLMSLALAFGITFYAIPAIIFISNEKRLFDMPDERKIHKTPIPSLGGLGMFAGFMMAFILTITFTGSYAGFQYVVAALLIMFFVGVKDDILIITPFKKFVGQLLAAAIIMFKGGYIINNMHGFLGIDTIPPIAAYCLTFFTIVVIINAFNLIDGVDGLAGSLGMFSTAAFGLYFFANGSVEYGCLAASLVGAIAAFLIFNFNPAKIFMGDTGSMMIGTVNAVLVIHFIQTADTASVLPVDASPAIGFAILFVPLFDTLRVFSIRMLHGYSPFTPDRNHIHHILLDKGLGHKAVTFILLGTNVVFGLFGFFGQALGTNILLLSLLTLGFAAIGLLVLTGRRRRLVLIKEEVTGTNARGKTKIRLVSLPATSASKEAANN